MYNTFWKAFEYANIFYYRLICTIVQTKFLSFACNLHDSLRQLTKNKKISDKSDSILHTSILDVNFCNENVSLLGSKREYKYVFFPWLINDIYEEINRSRIGDL